MRIRYSKLFVGICLPALCTGLASLLLSTSANAQTIRPSTQKELKVFDPTTNGTGNIGLRAAAGTSSYTLTLPASAPTENQVLSASAVTGGNVSLTWATPFTGSGTTNYVSKFATAGTLTNSLLFDNGTNVGIGTALPDSRVVSSYGTLEAFNSSDIRTTTALLLTATDPGTTSANRGVSLAFRPIIGRGAAATITVYNANDNKEGGVDIAFNSGGSLYPSTVSERMRITSTGNVGIGTANPYSLLELNSGANTSAIRIFDNDHNGSASVFPYTVASYWARGSNVRRTGTNPLAVDGATAAIAFTDEPGNYTFETAVRSSSILFYTANNNNAGNVGVVPTERMRITSTGNVGVGTTTPSARLEVSSSSGGGYFNERAARILHSGAGSIGSNTVGNFSAGLEIVSQKSNFNGVGGANSRLLYLSAPQYTSSTSGNDYPVYQVGVYIDDLMSYYGINSGAGAATYGIYAKGGHSNYFEGSTGIGTATPVTKLVVEGEQEVGAPSNGNKSATLALIATNNAANAGGSIEFGGRASTTAAAIKLLTENSNSYTRGHLAFYTRPSTTDVSMTEAMRITAAGAVGIGTTSPQAALEVSSANSSSNYESGEQVLVLRNSSPTAPAGARGSGIRFLYGTSNSGSAQIDLIKGSSNEEGSLSFGTRNSSGTIAERMRITSAGAVGIGITTPGSVLQVNGNAAIGYSASTAAPTNGLAIAGTIVQNDVGTVVSNRDFVVGNLGTLDLTISSYASFVGHLYVINTNKLNAGIRTQSVYFVAGRLGNNTTITLLNTANGSNSGAAFTVTDVSVIETNNILRITNTSGATTAISAVFVGSLGF